MKRSQDRFVYGVVRSSVRNSGLPIAVLVLLLLAGCAAQPVASNAAQGASEGSVSMSAAQVAALSDHKVTYAEYEAGWRRYIACDAKAGYVVRDLGESNEVHHGAIPEAAVNSGVDAKCYGREFKQIDTVWQTSRENTSSVAQAYRECLVAAGVTPQASEGAMYAQLQKINVDPHQCVVSHE